MRFLYLAHNRCLPKYCRHSFIPDWRQQKVRQNDEAACHLGRMGMIPLLPTLSLAQFLIHHFTWKMKHSLIDCRTKNRLKPSILVCHWPYHPYLLLRSCWTVRNHSYSLCLVLSVIEQGQRLHGRHAPFVSKSLWSRRQRWKESS